MIFVAPAAIPDLAAALLRHHYAIAIDNSENGTLFRVADRLTPIFWLEAAGNSTGTVWERDQ
jgi:hypothetical protein